MLDVHSPDVVDWYRSEGEPDDACSCDARLGRSLSAVLAVTMLVLLYSTSKSGQEWCWTNGGAAEPTKVSTLILTKWRKNPRHE